MRWIALALTSPRYWSLRPEWPDLQQEILARLIESLRLGRFDPERNLRTYVQGIVRYTALEAMERPWHNGDRRGVLGLLQSRDPGWEQQAIHHQIARRVMDLASEDCRELIRAYFYEDRSYGEIATTAGMPVGTVKSRLFRCLDAAHHLLMGTVRRLGARRAHADGVHKETRV